MEREGGGKVPMDSPAKVQAKHLVSSRKLDHC